MKKLKTKTEMLRRNDPVIKSVESVLRLEGSLWWERFAKRGRSWARRDRERELRMVRVVSWQSGKCGIGA